MSDAGIMISAQIIARDIRGARRGKAGPESVARIAFASCLKEASSWMLRNDDQKFRAGCGGMLLYYRDDDEVRERIEYELRMLQSLSAATSGVPVDFATVLREDLEPIGLLKIFREAKGETGADGA